MKNIFITTALIFTLSSGFSAQEKDSVQVQSSQLSDAEYLTLVKEYTLNPDGSMDYHFVKKQKLNTYRSFQNLMVKLLLFIIPGFKN